MSENIFVSHSVYLTLNERQTLHEGSTIKTVGISVPVPNIDASLTEVFVHYYLIQDNSGENKIELLSDGYKITLGNIADCERITNPHDETFHWLKIDIENKIEKNDKTHNVNHQIMIQDTSILNKTTLCEQLGHFLKKTPKK